jgi:pimeloyl-ACP methyl ester carboxylesterase
MQVLSRVSPEGAAAVAERMFLTPRRRERPAAEIALLERARRTTLPTRYGTLAAWEWGDTPSGAPTVLLVHGWEGRGAQLGALVPLLTSMDFRVVTFDAPGHGDSPGSRSSFFHFADAVQHAARAFGPLHAIVSHSMGGAVTVWASRDEALARRLVLIAPPIDLRDFTRAFSKTLGLPEEVRGRVHRRLGTRFGVPIEDARAERIAATLHGPLLVVHDQDDREVPIACGEAIARAWPGSELLRTRGLGHQRILRDPNTLQAVVRFVAQKGQA